MAIIKPFKGIRPPKDLVEKVESRPYDVLDSEEARAEAGDNEMSLYHIIKPEIDFPVGTSEYDPRVYEKAAENFQKFQDNGWLVQDSREHYYIYAQTMSGKTQYGLVVCAHTDDYMAGRIKKHELTRRDMYVLTMPISNQCSLPIPTMLCSTSSLCVMQPQSLSMTLSHL